jgi:hypothetical protein
MRVLVVGEGATELGRSAVGFANKLQAVLALPAGREADAIVMVVDREGLRNRDRIHDLNEGRDALQAANKPCAVGVAIEMIEAWLMADERALQQALGSHSVGRQPDPETLASREEQSDLNPKGRLRRIMEQSLGGPVYYEDYPLHCAAIASTLAIGVLEERCPEGFRPFATQVRGLAKL